MLHQNTPLQDVNISPAVMLFGRAIKDHLPSSPNKIRVEWKKIAEMREDALAKRHIRNVEKYNYQSRELQPLCVGDAVILQNQYGNSPRRWHKTGTIVEVGTNRQYQVKVDGSNRITLRNRRFLKKILLMIRNESFTPHHTPESEPHDEIEQEHPSDHTDPPQPDIYDDRCKETVVPSQEENRATEVEVIQVPEATLPPRRSTRETRKPSKFESQMKGKTHVEFVPT